MHLEDRVILIWLSWIIGGLCGVVILLVVICYCRLMPRHQKSFDEQYLKEHYSAKECLPTHSYTHDGYRVKHAEVQVQRHSRPVSYGGQVGSASHRLVDAASGTEYGGYRNTTHYDQRSANTQYASSSMLDEIETEASLQALKTRSLPAFLRPQRPRPLSTEDDLQQLYAKVNLSKKYKNRMRNEHAAIIALSKSQSQCLDADAVIVYDQRTAL